MSSWAAVPIGNIDVGRDVTAGFGEVQIPLVSPDMKVPLIYSADIDGAVRYEAYDPGDSTWVPKVGFVLRPIKDIAVRGSFSKSFIAPTLYETNGPASSGFTSSIEFGPATGDEQAQVLTGGSNPKVDNTIADNYTAGIVISPHQVPGLTLNADFFHVEEKRIVGTIADTIDPAERQPVRCGVAFRGPGPSGQLHGSDCDRAEPACRQSG